MQNVKKESVSTAQLDFDRLVLEEWERRRRNQDALTRAIKARWRVLDSTSGERHGCRIGRSEVHAELAEALHENPSSFPFIRRVKEALFALGVTEVTVKGDRCYKGLYRI